MSELDKVIRNEYNAASELEIMYTGTDKEAMGILENKLSTEEYMKVERVISQYINDVEFSAFQQGFIRGVAITKGGVL